MTGKDFEDVVRAAFDRAAAGASVWTDPADRVRAAARRGRRNRLAATATAAVAVVAVGTLTPAGSDGELDPADRPPLELREVDRIDLPAGFVAESVDADGSRVFVLGSFPGGAAELLTYNRRTPDAGPARELVGGRAVDVATYAGETWVGVSHSVYEEVTLVGARSKSVRLDSGVYSVAAVGGAWVGGGGEATYVSPTGQTSVAGTAVYADDSPPTVVAADGELVVALATGGATGRLVALGPAATEQRATTRVEGRPRAVAVSAHTGTAYVARDGDVRVYDAVTLAEEYSVPLQDQDAIAAGGQWLWAARSGQLTLYDVSRQTFAGRVALPPIADLAADGPRAWVATDRVVYAFDAGPPRPTPEPLEVGRWYRHQLYTHCGIEYTQFNNEYWRTEPLDDGNGNPPPGWGNPDQAGEMRLRSDGKAEFRSYHGRTLVFTRDPDAEPPPCD